MDIRKLWNLNPSPCGNRDPSYTELAGLGFAKLFHHPNLLALCPWSNLSFSLPPPPKPLGFLFEPTFFINSKVSKWMAPAAATAHVPLCCYQYRPSSPALVAAVPCQIGTVLVIIPILFARESHCSSENIWNHFPEGSAPSSHHQPWLP